MMPVLERVVRSAYQLGALGAGMEGGALRQPSAGPCGIGGSVTEP
jgi:hypothetical protein